MVASSSSSSQPRRRARGARPPLSRPPIILEFASNICRAGHAGDSRPRRHVLAENSAASSYATLLQLVRTIFHQLGQDPTERRLIVLTEGLFVETTWKTTLLTVLWSLSVPAVSFLSALNQIPAAVPVLAGIVCQISSKEAHCIVFAEETMLPFTYQVVPYDSILLQDPSHPQSIVTALLKCLEASPRDERKTAIKNLIFTGEICTQSPGIDRQVAAALQSILKQPQARRGDPSPEEVTTAESENDAIQLTTVPVQFQELKALAESVGVLRTPYRPDLLPFVGTSVWVAQMHNRPMSDEQEQGDKDSVFKWIQKPTDM